MPVLLEVVASALCVLQALYSSYSSGRQFITCRAVPWPVQAVLCRCPLRVEVDELSYCQSQPVKDDFQRLRYEG